MIGLLAYCTTEKCLRALLMRLKLLFKPVH
uniref:Uncharacterized protein n=1 Tax=Arundo donax TaxID=35708 RepID=A0A0A8XTT8_ARUDO